MIISLCSPGQARCHITRRHCSVSFFVHGSKDSEGQKHKAKIESLLILLLFVIIINATESKQHKGPWVVLRSAPRWVLAASPRSVSRRAEADDQSRGTSSNLQTARCSGDNITFNARYTNRAMTMVTTQPEKQTDVKGKGTIRITQLQRRCTSHTELCRLHLRTPYSLGCNQARTHKLWPAATQPQSAILVVSTPVIHVNTWITTHLQTLEVSKADP